MMHKKQTGTSIQAVVFVVIILALAAITGAVLWWLNNSNKAIDRSIATATESIKQTYVDYLARAEQAFAGGNLATPKNDNALELYQLALENKPDLQQAAEGIRKTKGAITNKFHGMLDSKQYAAAGDLLKSTYSVSKEKKWISLLQKEFVAILASQKEEALKLVNDGDIEAGKQLLRKIEAINVNLEGIGSISTLLSAENTKPFINATSFQDPFLQSDQMQGPEMIVIEAYQPTDEDKTDPNKLPHYPTKSYAIAKHEITIDQFSAFIYETNYKTDAEKVRYSHNYNSALGTTRKHVDIYWIHDFLGNTAEKDLPVIHVSWNDASAYVKWLNKKTGKAYRLPTEAEFEYAARSGASTKYWWGDNSPKAKLSNLAGSEDRLQGQDRGWGEPFRDYEDGYWGPAPVASFQPNYFGVYDTLGNVSEWMLDCWSSKKYPHFNATYAQKMLQTNCKNRLIKGGSWSSSPSKTKVTYRIQYPINYSSDFIGFRVVRDIE